MRRPRVRGGFVHLIPLSGDAVGDMHVGFRCMDAFREADSHARRDAPARQSDYEIPRTAWAYITGPGRP